MAKSKRKRNSGGNAPRKSTTTRMLQAVGAIGAGAVVGALSGRASLGVGLASVAYGVIKNVPLATVAGAAACFVPGQLSTSEKSTAGGLKALIEDGKSSLKILAAQGIQKTAVDKFFPNAFPSLALGDVDYYGGPTLAEQQFTQSLQRLNGMDEEVGGFDEMNADMGRTLDNTFSLDAAGDATVGGFEDVAQQAGRGW